MSGVIVTNPKVQFLGANGAPLVGGTLTTYLAGTTTPTATYQDEALTAANTNPIVLDARGECLLWLDSTKNYKFVLANSSGVVQWTVDDISGADSGLRDALAAANGASLIGYTGPAPTSAVTTVDQLAATGTNKGADLVGFLQAGNLAVPTTVQAKLRETVSVLDFGASESAPAATNTAAINAAAAYCRSSGAELVIPAVATFYAIDGTLDLSDIKNIDGQGAELRGTFSGSPAAIIGGSTTTFRGAEIYLKVRNTPDESTTAGTHGIKFLNLSNSRLTLFSRGFLNGLYFDGNSGANRVWVDNRIDVLELYNNQNHVHFDLGGGSYAVKNQFVGGSYFLGTTLTSSNKGAFNITLAGNAQVADILVESPEIGLNRSAIDLASYAVFVYATLNTSLVTSTIQFKDVRIEGYGSWGSDNPYGINIASAASGRIGVDVEISGSVPSDVAYTIFQIYQPAYGLNKIRLTNNAIRAQQDRSYPQIVIPNKVVPYTTSARCYVPGRIIFDNATGFGTPVNYFGSQYTTNGVSRACGDGDIISGVTTDSYGLIYEKGTSSVSFLELLTPEQFVVICYDVNGNVLSGTTPSYVAGENGGPITYGAVSMYRCSGRWLWLHKDVHSFYIGAARWSSNGKLNDIAFRVLYGPVLREKNDTFKSPFAIVSHTTPNQAFLPSGTVANNENNSVPNGYQNQFALKTTTSAGASSGSASITLTSASGIAAGYGIGIELDTEIAPGLRRYQYTTVSSVVGSTINLSASLLANVASGRTVLVNRWRIQDIVPYFALATEIADVASSLNTTRKQTALVVYDSTNKRLMVATSSAPNADWYVVDGSAFVTPT